MLLGLPAGSLMVSKGPEGVLLIAEKDDRRAVAIQTKSLLFTLTGLKNGHSIALFTRPRAARFATGVGEVWSQPRKASYDLEGWARQVVAVDAPVQPLDPKWLPKDAFSPQAYLRFGDTIEAPGHRVVFRFDPNGGSLDEQAGRQSQLDRILKARPIPVRITTVFWFGDEASRPEIKGFEVTALDRRHPLRRLLGKSQWAIIDRLGHLRAFGTEETLAARTKQLDVTEEG